MKTIKNKKTDIVDAEIIKPEKSDGTQGPSPVQLAIEQLGKAHGEKGGLAFELLKSLITGKAHNTYTTDILLSLNATAFQLADLFKHEMDVRWNAAMADIANKFNPKDDVDTSDSVTH